jgi:hypothetical protein
LGAQARNPNYLDRGDELKIPGLSALAIALFALSGAAVFAGENLSPGVREDRCNRWVIVAFALLGLLDGYLPAYSDRKEFWTIDDDVWTAMRGGRT